MNKCLYTLDGEMLFPEYLSAEKRSELYERAEKSCGDIMYCGCRQDVKLFYRVSKDLKIYPAGHNYIHFPGCCMAVDDKKAFMQDVESGDINVRLRFKPNTFTYVAESDDVQEGSARVYEHSSKDGSDVVNKLDLFGFARDLFIDCFNERVADGKPALSHDYFYSAVIGKLKRIRLNGMKISLRDCKLEEQGFQFFVQPFRNFKVREMEDGRKNYSLEIEGKNGKKYEWFIYEGIALKAMEKFEKRYGESIESANFGTMCVGFRYLVNKKGGGGSYKAIGRIEIVGINSNGIVCRSKEEIENLDMVIKTSRFHDGKLFLGSSDDYFDVAYFDGKIRNLFCSSLPKGLTGYDLIKGNLCRRVMSEEQVKAIFEG